MEAARLDHELGSASGNLRAHTEIQGNEGHGHLVLKSMRSRENPIKASSSSSDGTASLQSGAECSITSSTKALQKGVGSDTGILSLCAKDEVCFEDKTSSLGGRCVVLRDEEVARERRLVECVMSDGSAGTKCDGVDACYGIDPDTVGCNSCVGVSACKYAAGPIGEGSCNGNGACYPAAGSIGDGSCIGQWSCFNLKCELNYYYSSFEFKTLAETSRSF